MADEFIFDRREMLHVNIERKNYIDFDKINVISLETGIEENNLYSYVDSWIKKNGEWYFVKSGMHYINVINELIGEVISDYFNLETVHYKLCEVHDQKGISYGIISKNFYDRKYDYKRFRDIGVKRGNNLEILDRIKSICKDDMVYINLLKDLKKLFIRDFYTSQKDRSNNNFLFKCSFNEIRLAPLFDYEYSFDSFNISNYRNALGCLNIDNEKTLNILKDDYFQKLLYKIMDIDMNLIIQKVENFHKISIPAYDKVNYMKHDYDMKNMVSKVLKGSLSNSVGGAKN